MNIGSTLRYLPHQGNVRILCILAQYQDVQFTVNNPVTAFEQLMNGDTQADLGNMNQYNVASVRQYFHASSHGQFSPQFDVVGPVTLPKNMEDYGGTKSDGSDDRFKDFCSDAIEKVKEETWSPTGASTTITATSMLSWYASSLPAMVRTREVTTARYGLRHPTKTSK